MGYNNNDNNYDVNFWLNFIHVSTMYYVRILHPYLH